MEVFTIDPRGTSRSSFLAVFSFEEEAQTCMSLLQEGEKEKKGWSIRQTTPGELVSVLLALCADSTPIRTSPKKVVSTLRAFRRCVPGLAEWWRSPTT
jgi:hypothetical protein